MQLQEVFLLFSLHSVAVLVRRNEIKYDEVRVGTN